MIIKVKNISKNYFIIWIFPLSACSFVRTQALDIQMMKVLFYHCGMTTGPKIYLKFPFSQTKDLAKKHFLPKLSGDIEYSEMPVLISH
jgi:hypothetical protein